jgi:hypothetical protein
MLLNLLHASLLIGVIVICVWLVAVLGEVLLGRVVVLLVQPLLAWVVVAHLSVLVATVAATVALLVGLVLVDLLHSKVASTTENSEFDETHVEWLVLRRRRDLSV